MNELIFQIQNNLTAGVVTRDKEYEILFWIAYNDKIVYENGGGGGEEKKTSFHADICPVHIPITDFVSLCISSESRNFRQQIILAKTPSHFSWCRANPAEKYVESDIRILITLISRWRHYYFYT